MATIRKRKDRYQAQVRISKQQISRTFTRRSDAQAWARETEIAVQKGNFEPTYKPSQETLGEILKRYLLEVTPKKRSPEVEAIKIKRLMREAIARRPCASLRPIHFAQFRDERLKQVTGGMTLKDLSLLSHAIEVARRDWGLPINGNPARQITKPKQNRARDRRLKDGEQERLLDACSQSQNPYLRPLVIVAVETAMRRGELLGLERQHLNLNNRTAYLPMTKNGEDRTVPLSTRAITTFKALPVHISGQVFPLSETALRGLWRRACRRAGIIDLHIHDLRHEATSRLFELGLNIMEVAAITGHKDLASLKRYTHLRAEDLARKLR